MKKLSEFQGEDAIDVLADLIEPIAMICSDEELRNMVGAKLPKLKIVQYLLKQHKHEVLEVLAILNGETVETFKCNIMTLPTMVLEVLNDEELQSFFTSQVASMADNASHSATVNTEEAEAKQSHS